jgi:hypothetical protein
VLGTQLIWVDRRLTPNTRTLRGHRVSTGAKIPAAMPEKIESRSLDEQFR